MYKKLLLYTLILPVLLFTGCFGGGEEATDGSADNFRGYDLEEIYISVPTDWEVIEASDLPDDIAQNEAVIVFRDNVKNAVFTPNAHVIMTKLNKTLSATDFGKSKINEHKNTLLNYKEVSRDDEYKVLVNGEEQNTILVLFEGKASETDELVRFIQLYAVKDSNAYTATAAYLETSPSHVLEDSKEIVKSFEVK